MLLCCGIVLTKNACGASPPPSLSYDDTGGSPRKGGLFLLNVVGVDLFSLRRTSWHFCLVKFSTPILSEILPKQFFKALREDASFLF